MDKTEKNKNNHSPAEVQSLKELILKYDEELTKYLAEKIEDESDAQDAAMEAFARLAIRSPELVESDGARDVLFDAGDKCAEDFREYRKLLCARYLGADEISDPDERAEHILSTIEAVKENGRERKKSLIKAVKRDALIVCAAAVLLVAGFYALARYQAYRIKKEAEKRVITQTDDITTLISQLRISKVSYYHSYITADIVWLGPGDFDPHDYTWELQGTYYNNGAMIDTWSSKKNTSTKIALTYDDRADVKGDGTYYTMTLHFPGEITGMNMALVCSNDRISYSRGFTMN